MIITRTPFRISFAGGESDLEAYYREEAAVVLTRQRAGNGGFLLFDCEPHLRSRVREEYLELTEVEFGFDPHGTKVVYVGGDR
jgi:galactokinase/mevalonate kinase-like predicted kinase